MADALKQQGNSAFQRGEWHQAIGLYSKAIEQNPDLIACWSNRAMSYIKLEQWREAVRDCTMGIDRATSPQDDKICAKMHYRMGTAYRQLKEVEKCREALERVLELSPTEQERALIRDDLKSLQWDMKRDTRKQKFSMYSGGGAAKKRRDDGDDNNAEDMRGEYIDVKVVDNLPAHLKPGTKEKKKEEDEPEVLKEQKRMLKSSFQPPEKLTNFTFTQLMRASEADKPEIYEYVFSLDPSIFPQIYQQGGVNYDAIEFVLDSIAYCHDSNSDGWLERSTALITALSQCSRFSTIKIFTSGAKLDRIKQLDSTGSLANTISSIF